MDQRARLDEAFRRIDAANAEDPRTDFFESAEHPRELIFSKRVYDWVLKLSTAPSEALLLATRAHTLRRWMVPRDRYPRTNLGYHEWRDACAAFHAEQAAKILGGVGYTPDIIGRVLELIMKKNWRNDPDGRTLEDADCLAFLELKLARLAVDWDDEKTIVILRNTLSKMTPKGREIAATIPLEQRCAALLDRAAN